MTPTNDTTEINIEPNRLRELEGKSVELASELLFKAEDWADNSPYAKGPRDRRMSYAIGATMKQLGESVNSLRSVAVNCKYEFATEKSEEMLITILEQRTILIGAAEFLADMFNFDFNQYHNIDEI